MEKASIQAWVSKLHQKSMPVVGSVITELNKLTESDESNANNLADVILRDPNLTAHVLRVANSVHYNYSSLKINTISRAIVLIGLKGMRAICITLLILDRLLGDQPKARVLALVAQGFHAATQAQNILNSCDSQESEEVFIAALLLNLGEMAFWMSQPPNSVNELLLNEDPNVRKAAMDEILGGSFKRLTKALARYWKLGDIIQEALFPSSSPSANALAVITGDRVSRAALYGWESPQFEKVLGEVALIRCISRDEAIVEIKQFADKASVVAVTYGASDVCPMIPNSTKAGAVSKHKSLSKILKPDAQLQLSILTELSTTASERLGISMIFQMCIEGMHRGVGLERVAIAFIQGHKVKAKYMLGDGTEHWRSEFVFDVGPYTDNVFTYVMAENGIAWIDRVLMDELDSELYPEDIKRVLGQYPCLIYVIKVGSRNAAVFYADRWHHGGQINEEQFENFKHFASQAQFSLNSISSDKTF